MNTNQTFASIPTHTLSTVTGGKTDSDAQLTAMLTTIGDSIKQLSENKNKTDPTQMIMMMMMMGGMGRGGGTQVAAAPPPEAAPAPAAAPNIVNVNVGRRRWG